MWVVSHENRDGVESLGVDEIQWQRVQQYLTLVYQINVGMKRLLYVVRDCTADGQKQFFDVLGEEHVLG